MRFLSLFFAFFSVSYFTTLEAKPAKLDPATTRSKVEEILRAHVSQKTLSRNIAERSLGLFVDKLDSHKVYLLKEEVEPYIHAKEAFIDQVLSDYAQGKFTAYEQLYSVMLKALDRREALESQIDDKQLPTDVTTLDLDKLDWCQTKTELLERLVKIKAVQKKAGSKLPLDAAEKMAARITKARLNFAEEIRGRDSLEQSQNCYTTVVKAIVSSLDANSSYFTPDEATSALLHMQKRLIGVGIVFSDDLIGFRISSVIEGGPAQKQGKLQAGDLIVSINGENVIGQDSQAVADLIRGKDGTQVTLGLLRGASESFELTLTRGAVVISESRLSTHIEPFSDGVIAVINLQSYYADENTNSAKDIAKAITDIQAEHKLHAVILDLRQNTGGIMPVGIEVASLFLKPGVIVSVKDPEGNIQRYRNFNEPLYSGPLFVAISPLSASCSEITAQTLQDYGRALILGDERSYGKGTFQLSTIGQARDGTSNPQGEYTVTQGIYYTVSGNTPQLTGVRSDVVIPGAWSKAEVGEHHMKYPLPPDSVAPAFTDDLTDMGFLQRLRLPPDYTSKLQPVENLYEKSLATLRTNSEKRLKQNTDYQNLLKVISRETENDKDEPKLASNDLQMAEIVNVVKDALILNFKL